MSLELFFLRHAIAEEPGTPGYNELSRPLTPEGIEKMILEAKGMKKLGLKFEVLLASPLTRAQQTAEIVKKHLPFKGDLETENLLAPGSTLSALLKKINSRKEKSFMLVGHEPSLSLWIQSLLKFSPENSALMKKGALCHLILQGEGSSCEVELISLLQPRALRLAAG